MLRRFLSITFMLLVGPMLLGCQLNLLSEEHEIALGAEAAPQFEASYGGPIPDEHVVRYVADFGRRLAAQSERPDLPWQFNAVDSASVNAFALPGGKLFITRGLLEKLDNEAQLVGVMGHEVAHVTNHHVGKQMTQNLLIQLGVAAIGTAAAVSDEDWLDALGVGASTGGALYSLHYSRSHETESDTYGLRYAAELGYNPKGLRQVMGIFKSMGGARAPEFLSTHPYPDSRIENIDRLIKKNYPRADEPGAYKWGKEAYEQNVLSRLKQLPAPVHQPKDGS